MFIWYIYNFRTFYFKESSFAHIICMYVYVFILYLYNSVFYFIAWKNILKVPSPPVLEIEHRVLYMLGAWTATGYIYPWPLKTQQEWRRGEERERTSRSWEGERKGTSESEEGMRMGAWQPRDWIKVHYTHVWKCHSETHYFAQLIYNIEMQIFGMSLLMFLFSQRVKLEHNLIKWLSFTCFCLLRSGGAGDWDQGGSYDASQAFRLLATPQSFFLNCFSKSIYGKAVKNVCLNLLRIL